MHDRIDAFFLHNVRYEIGGGDVPLYEFKVFETGNVIEVGEAAAVVEFVVDDNVVLGVLFGEEDGHVRSDEA